ncbi:MAG: cation:proton antiporter [Solirubrobacterales bacterium]|nr:cation:proton antiporter [Solirubrobacterales bacterium]
MDIGFPEALTVVGLLLIAAAAASGLVQRTVLSISVLSVTAGVVLDLAGVVALDPGAQSLVYVVELVLLITLFGDGLLVERQFLREHWRAPARALAVAMPLNAALLAIAAKALFGDLSWAEAFLLGFVLSPTDPVITSSIVTSVKVPTRVRNIVNLESGLNDGLALPFVLLFLELSIGDTGELAGTIGGLSLETLLGVAVGATLALAAGLLLGRLPDWALEGRFEGLYALGLGLAAFGVAELFEGNGLIAAFCAGLVLAVTRHEIPEIFSELNESVGAVLQVVAFALFGALIVETGLDVSALPLAAFIAFALLLARPASILVSFVGIPLTGTEKGFIAWFGPKGIASMLFALFVLNSGAPDRSLVFDVAAFTILASILAHGLTDTLGARWVERRMSARGPG